MKSFIVLFTLLLSSTAFSQVVTKCKLGADQVITVSKEGGKYTFAMNGDNAGEVADVHILETADALKDDMVVEIASYIRVDMKKVTRVEAFTLRADDDGGLTLITYYAKTKKLKSTLVSMGGPVVCK